MTFEIVFWDFRDNCAMILLVLRWKSEETQTKKIVFIRMQTENFKAENADFDGRLMLLPTI